MSKLIELLKTNGSLEGRASAPLGPHRSEKFSMAPFSDREKAYLPILAYAFANKDLPPHLGPAIARVESSFKPDAVNNTSGDGARGGAYGLCQITLKTALELDDRATVVQLLSAEYNARLAALLCWKNAQRADCHSTQDIIAMYNSGKCLSKAPMATYAMYVPQVLVFMARYNWKCRQYVKAI